MFSLTFPDEQIDGAAFMELSESDVKSLVKPLGQVKKIVRLVNSKVKVSKQILSTSEHPLS